jgi:hypothetical protein
MLYRLCQMIDQLLSGVFRRKQPKAGTEQLASEIVEYGRMNSPRPGLIIVEVPEVAYRLRESPRNVRRSLRLLQSRGIAKKIVAKDHWKLIT